MSNAENQDDRPPQLTSYCLNMRLARCAFLAVVWDSEVCCQTLTDKAWKLVVALMKMIGFYRTSYG